jgi:hypothetical protein
VVVEKLPSLLVIVFTQSPSEKNCRGVWTYRFLLALSLFRRLRGSTVNHHDVPDRGGSTTM